jgi:hypothetical protein
VINPSIHFDEVEFHIVFIGSLANVKATGYNQRHIFSKFSWAIYSRHPAILLRSSKS